ncbi:MAG: hypothetical protein IIA45_02920 [Bacteroidetes bacterium]|nr:hypothetical protein [Bacteroidota bacterium]
MGKILLLLLIIIPSVLHAQCGDGLVEICASEKGNFVYAKAFNIQMNDSSSSGSSEYKNYSYVLTRNTTYRIICCSDEENVGKMVIELYGPSGLISSTYDSASDKHISAIEYDCPKTGRYILNFYFEGGSGGCGVGLVTFRTHF